MLHAFAGGKDGGQPNVNLVRDKTTGALYGTTPWGPVRPGCGTVFSVVPSGETWTFGTLYDFAGGSDGCTPDAAIHGGPKKGTYFSTTLAGGPNNAGTVYELDETNGAWTESVDYSFAGADGSAPQDLDVDPDTGNMYGVAMSGGVNGHGVVFELTRNGQGWTQSVLYNFTGGADGDTPLGLHFEKSTGALFGTTEKGGSGGRGTLFMLVQNGSSWTETVLHSFSNSGNDGLDPQSRPVEDPDTGVLYGTTNGGGKYGSGTVYAVVP